MFAGTLLPTPVPHALLAMQKVEGSNPFSRFRIGLRLQATCAAGRRTGLNCGAEHTDLGAVWRVRMRPVAAQSWLRRMQQLLRVLLAETTGAGGGTVEALADAVRLVDQARRAFAPSRRRRAVAAPTRLQGTTATNGKAEMITTMTSTDPLVEALASRLRVMDLVGWQRIATWAEESELSFEDVRLLLALAVKMDEGPVVISELADLAGFSLDVAYPATHRLRGRGYLREERRRYALSPEGEKLVALLDAAHREGIQAYVDQLDREEQQRLRKALANPR